MEHSDLHPPPAEVRTLTGYKIPKVNPGQPRFDPRAAMRPSAAPRTPPKPSARKGGPQENVSAKTVALREALSNPIPLRGGRGVCGGSRGAGRGRGGGSQPSTPALQEEPRPDSINNRGGKSSRGPKNCRKAGGHLKTPFPGTLPLRELVSK